jgi:hypothetical protein
MADFVKNLFGGQKPLTASPAGDDGMRPEMPQPARRIANQARLRRLRRRS